MWFLLFFIVIPFILFIGFLVFSILAIFLIDRIFHKKYSQYFSLILPCFSLIFYFMLIMGGISFKSIDPQYYEFKRLCKNDKINIYDEKYRNMQQRYREAMLNNRDIKANAHNGIESFYDKEMDLEVYPMDWKESVINTQKVGFGIGDIIEKEIDYWYIGKVNKVKFANFKRYIYIEKGLWLRGDEGAGFYWKTENRLDCNAVKN